MKIPFWFKHPFQTIDSIVTNLEVLFKSWMMFIVLFSLLIVAGCVSEQSAPQAAEMPVEYVDSRYSVNLPVVDLRLPIREALGRGKVSGVVEIYEESNKKNLVDSFPIENGLGVYKDKLILSNKGYNYVFKKDGYYPEVEGLVARIPIGYVGDNVSLNYTFEPMTVYKKGSVNFARVVDMSDFEEVSILKPIILNVSETYTWSFEIRLEANPFVFSPSIVFEDGYQFDKGDMEYYPHIVLDCDNDFFDYRENYIRPNPLYRVKTAKRYIEINDINEKEIIDCDLMIVNPYRTLMNGDFVFYFRAPNYVDPFVDYAKDVNVSQVVKFKFVR